MLRQFKEGQRTSSYKSRCVGELLLKRAPFIALDSTVFSTKHLLHHHH